MEVHGHAADHDHAATSAVGGLAVAAGEYRLELDQRAMPAGQPSSFGFTVVGPHGPAREFDEHGGVQMHLIVVRRDLTGYQHLHPEPTPDGSWRTELMLPAAGVYRTFADFAHGGEQAVLGVDLFVAGTFAPEPLPEPTTLLEADGYRIELEAHAEAGKQAVLPYRISHAGEPIDLEPYLGSRGHLVALREGDLGYLHVHPHAEERGEIGFAATFPTAGNYRLFLQFKHEGRVQTAAFTLRVAEAR